VIAGEQLPTWAEIGNRAKRSLELSLRSTFFGKAGWRAILGGVFIVRMFISSGDDPKAKRRSKSKLRVIEAEFDVIEKCQYGASGPTVIVFRPSVMAAQRVPA